MTSIPQRQKGFTIVELLIVIVVIAILAAITIVSYNGIQSRARDAQTIAAVNAYIKGFTMYAIDNRAYPLTANTCIGEGYAGGLCWDNRVYTSNPNFATIMKPYMAGTLPNPSTKRLFMSTTEGSRAGILYVHGGFSFRYQLESKPPTSCGISGATLSWSSSTTEGQECNIALPNPAST